VYRDITLCITKLCNLASTKSFHIYFKRGKRKRKKGKRKTGISQFEKIVQSSSINLYAGFAKDQPTNLLPYRLIGQEESPLYTFSLGHIILLFLLRPNPPTNRLTKNGACSVAIYKIRH